MKVFTKSVFRWDETTDSYRLVPEESVSFNYEGPVALCKGDSTDSATEQAQQEEAAQQAAYNKSLMDIFTQQFGAQQGVLNYLKGQMQPMIENPQGYSPQELTSMRTTADDTLSNQYQNAQKTLNAQEFANGSRDLPSGVNDQLNGSLLASEAADKSNAQNTITQSDANLKQQNYWNAVNVLNGVATEENPLGYAGAATNAANAGTSAANSVANLSQAETSSQQSGLMSVLGGVAGGVFGAAGQAGGFGKLFSCHVAAKIFGEAEDLTGVKTTLVREWMKAKAEAHILVRPFVWIYSHTSKWLAKSELAVKALTPLFKRLLREAEAEAEKAKAKLVAEAEKVKGEAEKLKADVEKEIR